MGKLNYRIPNTNDFREIYVKVSDTLPIGAVCQYGGSTAPSGYLMCNGQAVSRTTYADLFKAIGTSFGAGDGVTTFNVPNFNGRVPVGLDGTDTDFDTIGETGGSKYLQEHSHNVAVAWGESGADLSNTYFPLQQQGPTYGKYVASGGSGGNFIKGAGTGNSGNLQPYIVTNFIIKASKKVALDRGNVVDSLDGSDTDSAPSVRAVNAQLDKKQNGVWTLLQDNVEKQTNVDLSNIDFNEIYVVIRNTTDVALAITQNVIKSDLTDTIKWYRNGYYYTAQINSAVAVRASLTQISFTDYYVNGSSTNAKMTVYYR